ncbi:hypothetical protein Klosneuvirus_5_50 [Klosneuvirus KNV1]|uniref:Zinc-ribbon domain-containing protein n=1 Tax=Klosneuvirus KNV1 TaxID=1977640 RepID=A0A1V0SKX7_9VIRU|nr:hypothetical protein Klosneuvirus_5_50 [Klosneuvirus KNV1]
MSDNITITEINKITKKIGVTCMDKEYVNQTTKLTWTCINNHTWERTWATAKQGYVVCSLCKKLEYKLKKLEELKEFARQNGGVCLATEYIDNKTKVPFVCRKGHTWEAVGKKKNWCQRCSNTVYSIEMAQYIASQRMGKCLSTTYDSYDEKLTWECYYGHVWEAQMRTVVEKTWCPKCKINIGEEITRCIFETLFNCKFERIRLEILNSLELDGYNENIQLAYEYDGIQHYQFVPRFHKTEDDFKAQQERDKLKDKLCKKSHIILIRIPYDIEYNKIKDHICQECNRLNIAIPNNIDIDHTKFTQIYKLKDEKYQELKKMVELKEGTLISTSYVHTDDPIEVKCCKGHIWSTTHHMIKNNKWCPKCNDERKHTIDEMYQIAQSREGECLSITYINNKTKLTWICRKGHIWNARPDVIIRSWCRTCYDEDRQSYITNSN